jgi:glutamate-1-semialdehyde 2,1-aminomutase
VVQEAGGFEAIIETMGATRLLWGSDFPVSQGRGRSVAVGDGMIWITPDMASAGMGSSDSTPIMHAYESLRALKLACARLKLGDSQIEGIFYGNAAALYDL